MRRLGRASYSKGCRASYRASCRSSAGASRASRFHRDPIRLTKEDPQFFHTGKSKRAPKRDRLSSLFPPPSLQVSDPRIPGGAWTSGSPTESSARSASASSWLRFFVQNVSMCFSIVQEDLVFESASSMNLKFAALPHVDSSTLQLRKPKMQRNTEESDIALHLPNEVITRILNLY